MWVGVLAVVAIAIALGWVVLSRTKDRQVKMMYVVPLWVAGACGVILGGAGLYYFQALRAYDLCVQRVDRSVGNRAQTLQEYATYDAGYQTTHWTSDSILPGLPSLR